MPDGLRIWAGLASDPFFIDPTVLKAVGSAFSSGSSVNLAGWQRTTAVNLFKGTTVNTIVLEISDGTFAGLLRPDQRIGVWGTTRLATDAGGWRPINRAGGPMIQPIFNPDDSERASTYNTTHPSEDVANYGDLFARLVARVAAAQGTSNDPVAYGKAVVGRILPDILPYRIGSQASFSFGSRDGRTLTDNAPDVMFSLVTNSPITTGLAGRDATAAPRGQFPYVAEPVRAPEPAGVA